MEVTEVIRVAIADANTLLREGLKRIFASESDLLIVGEANSEFDVLEVVERTKPDVLLLDLDLPKKGAMPILLLLNQKMVVTKPFILSLFREKERLLDAAKAGACGYALKSTFPATLMQAIKRVHVGEIWVDKHLDCAEAFVELACQTRSRDASGFSNTFGALSNREFEVLGLVGKGLSNAAISKRLFISPRTVKVHLYNVYQKLHVENRTQAALLLLNLYRHQAVDLTSRKSRTSKLSLDRKVLGTPVARKSKTRRPSFAKKGNQQTTVMG